jgi:hypothetical protein
MNVNLLHTAWTCLGGVEVVLWGLGVTGGGVDVLLVLPGRRRVVRGA